MASAGIVRRRSTRRQKKRPIEAVAASAIKKIRKALQSFLGKMKQAAPVKVSDFIRSPKILESHLKQLAVTTSHESEDLYLCDSYILLATNIYLYRRSRVYKKSSPDSQHESDDKTDLTRSERTTGTITNEIITGLFPFLGDRSFLVFNAVAGMHRTTSQNSS
jgi:hypothetical protein